MSVFYYCSTFCGCRVIPACPVPHPVWHLLHMSTVWVQWNGFSRRPSEVMMDGPRLPLFHFSPYRFQWKQPRSSAPPDSVVAADAASTAVFRAAPLFTRTREGNSWTQLWFTSRASSPIPPQENTVAKILSGGENLKTFMSHIHEQIPRNWDLNKCLLYKSLEPLAASTHLHKHMSVCQHFTV